MPWLADAADPFNQPSHEAKMTVKMTPDTYSGVAVEAIEATESTRSVRDPSRMPARMPIKSDTGTITANTQNIRMPVAPSAGNNFEATVVLNLVEQPKSPSRTPEKVGTTGSLQKVKRCVGLPVAGSVTGCLGSRPSHCP